MFGASTYSVLKIEYEWQERKGRVTSVGRWGGARWRVWCRRAHCSEDHVQVLRKGRRGHFNGAMEGAWRVFGAGAYIWLKIKYMRREKRKVESLQWGDGRSR